MMFVLQINIHSRVNICWISFFSCYLHPRRFQGRARKFVQSFMELIDVIIIHYWLLRGKSRRKRRKASMICNHWIELWILTFGSWKSDGSDWSMRGKKSLEVDWNCVLIACWWSFWVGSSSLGVVENRESLKILKFNVKVQYRCF
jgi:hypothetical protein